jgi:hypothetical protein
MHPHIRSQTEAHSPSGASHALRGGDLVGFVDLKEPSKPRVISAVPFVSKEPTGMLIVNDALIVAGEHDMMVFDMRASTPTREFAYPAAAGPPTAAASRTCACAPPGCLTRIRADCGSCVSVAHTSSMCRTALLLACLLACLLQHRWWQPAALHAPASAARTARTSTL